MLWVCGDVMRESDQASLLHGALELANNPSIEGAFHNYSGQFGSYWLIAFMQKGLNFAELSDYVSFGNYLALLIFLMGLAVYLGAGLDKSLKFEKGNSRAFVLVSVALTTPVIILSAPLLSSNVIAGGAVLALLGLNQWWKSNENIGGLIVGSILVFCSICLRKDAAFLLPLICFSPLDELDIRALWRRRYFWCFVAASGLALIVGSLVAPENYFPSLVLDWRLISCYSFFGLLGGWLVLLWGGITGFRLAHGVTKIIWLGAVAMPVLMYVLVLYSPRHFFMAGLIPLVLARSQWLKLGEEAFRYVKRLPSLALIVNLGWLVLAPKVQNSGALKIGVTNATCYPTADGLWPTGGGGNFLCRLARSQKEGRAVDHNQEWWNTWMLVDEKKIDPECELVMEMIPKSYGALWARFNGLLVVKEKSPESIILQSDREWVGAGRTMATGAVLDRRQEHSSYLASDVFHTGAGRCLFSYNKAITADKGAGGFTFEHRKRLLEKHPGVEFLSSLSRDDLDGHLYEEIDGKIYRSNYPAILIKYF